MKKNNSRILIACGIVAIGMTLTVMAIGADKKAKSEDLNSTFQCWKGRKADLADFKLKLITECDLDKPFSTSYSEGTIESGSYHYCCHTKQ